MNTNTETIVAIASAPGAGGVGIVRLSGPQARLIAETVCTRPLAPRIAHYARFRDADGTLLDDGIALYFAGPASFTGEDVAELQAHGSPVVLRQLVARCVALGARQARPGEFSERAFLNGKLDLAQAEAIADLIAAGDVQAARAARRSLDGVFSRRVAALMEALLAIRVHVEAAIDFADEPLETLGGADLRARLDAAIAQLAQLQREAARVAEGVAQHALDAVAADRMRIDLARHRQSQPRWGAVVQPVQREQRLGGAAAGFEHAVELDLRAHPRRPRE